MTPTRPIERACVGNHWMELLRFPAVSLFSFPTSMSATATRRRYGRYCLHWGVHGLLMSSTASLARYPSPGTATRASPELTLYLKTLRTNNPFRGQVLWCTTLRKFFAKSSTMPSRILESKDCFPSFTFAANGDAALSEIHPCGPRFTSAISPLLRSSI